MSRRPNSSHESSCSSMCTTGSPSGPPSSITQRRTSPPRGPPSGPGRVLDLRPAGGNLDGHVLVSLTQPLHRFEHAAPAVEDLLVGHLLNLRPTFRWVVHTPGSTYSMTASSPCRPIRTWSSEALNGRFRRILDLR